MENKKPDKIPIYLSAILPGLGQIFQKRWLAAISILCAFLACLVLLILVVFQFLSTGIEFASAFAEGAANKEPTPSPVITIISCLVLALLAYLISLCDVVLAYIRKYRSWAQGKLIEKLTHISVILAIASLPLFSFSVSAQDSTENIESTTTNQVAFDEELVANKIYRIIRKNDVPGLDTLMERYGSSAAQISLPGGTTPLHLAAALNCDIITAILLANDAEVEAKTPSGFTPLHWAAGRDSFKVAKILIAIGANIDAQTNLGITPAHWAADKNATNVLKLLILSNADIYAKTEQRMSPLHWAVRKNSTDASAMLAFKQTSDEEKDGKLPINADTPSPLPVQPSSFSPHPSPIPSSPIITKQSLVVHIGHGQDLNFVRIEERKLWVGKYEVTNGQYKRFRHKHRSMFRESFSLEGDDHPVVYVSWHDAKAYCKWLNKNFSGILPHNSLFRLPTNAEWTAFSSCGQIRKYPWGNDWPPRYGNFSDITARKSLTDWKGIRRYDDGYAVTCPVSKSGSNEWKIFGIAGNAWEWCEDWYGNSKKYKIRRGGSWDFDPKESLEIKTPGLDRPSASYDTIGFRLVVAKKMNH
ncbi:MAG: SUMF1/EgtB/PvdO family nonheme iron enzyme [Kiritimatiellae bacterium]|nr:SUMF1/EgtB/PvdO family nonheme iron enzyme [Kiritimatiellia bacterium]